MNSGKKNKYSYPFNMSEIGKMKISLQRIAYMYIKYLESFCDIC